MKSEYLFLGLVLVLIVSLGVVIALPNPSASYCVEMGYNYSLGNETCIFNENASCPAFDFYDGSCGSEYVVEVECAQAGEARGIITECCEGLDSAGGTILSSEGECELIGGGYGFCTDCGNGVCDEWEDKCSCEEDCLLNNSTTNETSECTEDSHCEEGYECEDNFCVLDNEDDNSTTVEDENETVVEKVCCLRTKTGNDSDQKYNHIEREDCVSSGGFVAEIVNESLCKQFRERWEIKNRAQEIFEERSGIECPDECKCRGSVITCPLEDGTTEMTIYAGNSGKIIIHIKGINVTTNATIIQDENGSLWGNFSGSEKRIKILPDEAKLKFKEKVRAKYHESEIELDDDGEYRIRTQKEARFLGMFKVRERVEGQVDSETGEVRVRNPWWGWLANDVED